MSRFARERSFSSFSFVSFVRSSDPDQRTFSFFFFFFFSSSFIVVLFLCLLLLLLLSFSLPLPLLLLFFFFSFLFSSPAPFLLLFYFIFQTNDAVDLAQPHTPSPQIKQEEHGAGRNAHRSPHGVDAPPLTTTTKHNSATSNGYVAVLPVSRSGPLDIWVLPSVQGSRFGRRAAARAVVHQKKPPGARRAVRSWAPCQSAGEPPRPAACCACCVRAVCRPPARAPARVSLLPRGLAACAAQSCVGPAASERQPHLAMAHDGAAAPGSVSLPASPYAKANGADAFFPSPYVSVVVIMLAGALRSGRCGGLPAPGRAPPPMCVGAVRGRGTGCGGHGCAGAAPPRARGRCPSGARTPACCVTGSGGRARAGPGAAAPGRRRRRRGGRRRPPAAARAARRPWRPAMRRLLVEHVLFWCRR